MTYEEMKAQAERVARALRAGGFFDDVEVIDAKRDDPIHIVVYTDGNDDEKQFVLWLDVA